MDAFTLQTKVLKDYSDHIHSFPNIRDGRIRTFVEQELAQGHLWPRAVVYHFFCKNSEPGGILESDSPQNKETPPWLTELINPYPPRY